ncbi:hypothetical protein DFQ27_002851 [Actinomortierella ambigua]|uniref:Uncharacterized protein n=1 Tax=Actinomortierella ambigua TaxID=1343610 RepID=A0A9P6UCW0_9FUNG|nr:hypothetical protein DFQ27_002851 [Actinomortierella ambigua]
MTKLLSLLLLSIWVATFSSEAAPTPPDLTKRGGASHPLLSILTGRPSPHHQGGGGGIGLNVGLIVDPHKLLQHGRGRGGGGHGWTKRAVSHTGNDRGTAPTRNTNGGGGSSGSSGPWSKRAVSHTGDDRGSGGTSGGYGDGNNGGGGGGGNIFDPLTKRAVSHTGDDRSNEGGGVSGGGGGEMGGSGGWGQGGYIVKRDSARSGNDRPDGDGGGDRHYGGGGSSDGDGGSNDGGHGTGGGNSLDIHLRSEQPDDSQPQRRALGGSGGGRRIGTSVRSSGSKSIVSEAESNPAQRRRSMPPWSSKLQRRHTVPAPASAVAETAAGRSLRPAVVRRGGRLSDSDDDSQGHRLIFRRRGGGDGDRDYIPSGTGSGNTYDKGQPFGRSL